MKEKLLLLLLLFWAGSCSASGGHWDYNLRVSSGGTKKEFELHKNKVYFFGLSENSKENRLVVN